MEITSAFEALFKVLDKLTPISDDSKALLAKAGRYVKFASGESIFIPGDITRELRFVCSGIACHYYIKPDGTRCNKSFLQIGEVASSLSSMHQHSPARFGCDALTAVECISLPYDKLQTLASQQADLQALTQAMLMRLALKKENREADLLLLSPTELYQDFCLRYPSLRQVLPNYHIASYLGISEVSLSRIRARLGVQNAYHKRG